jgi:hypothetical protein
MVLGWRWVFFFPPSLKLTHSQEVSIKASYEVQSHQLLVERIICTINEWKVLDDWQADGIEDFEAWLDFVLALCNLRQLEATGRLDEIPDKEPAGADRGGGERWMLSHRGWARVAGTNSAKTWRF